MEGGIQRVCVMAQTDDEINEIMKLSNVAIAERIKVTMGEPTTEVPDALMDVALVGLDEL